MEFNGTDKRYNQFSEHLKNKFEAKVYKITLDAGFSCPNRDGTISTEGCIFCDDGGSFSQAHSNQLSIEKQVNTGAETLKKRFKAQKFMSYFQAFSNTYKPVKELEKIYTAS
jgi:radical SAM superfamily enzyme